MEKGKLGLYICSGTVSTVIGTGAGYALSSGDCFTTAVVATCGCAIGVLATQTVNQKKKIKKLEKNIEKLNRKQMECERREKIWNSSWCFKAGTLVLTENGYKKIEDITEEDVVYSYNMETKTKELKRVVKTFINDCKEMLTVSVGEVSMNLTPNHTCYVNGEWVLASEIKIGDKLLDCDGNILTVSDVTKTSICEKVYNFEVEDNHNYFVTDLNILVHNDSSVM